VFGFSLHRFQLNDLASAALILLALTVVIHLTQLFSRVDNLIFDYGQKITTTTAPDDVIIIAIDQVSLAQIGRWPWSRAVHANLLQRLQSELPAVIGLDVIFAETEQANPAADALLAKAITESGKVVLPVLLETVRANGQVIETLPLPAFMQHAADVGRVHAVLDEDSIARSVYLHEGIGEPVWQLFSQAVLNVAADQPTQNKFSFDSVETSINPYGLAREKQRRINFSGPANHFNSISYAQVLSGDFPQGLFTNKIVLVGATALGMNDLLTTPVSGLSTPMAGVEFHANVLQSIRTNQLIHLMSPYISLGALLMLSVMPLLWMPKTSALIGFLSTLLFMGFIALAAGLLPTFSGVWLPPSAALVSLLLAYPIWSWRKLEAAQRFLDFELSYLKQNMITLPDESLNLSLAGYDQFEARIAQVRNATQQLRFLNAERKETLAFISHDLRAPIAGALSVLEQHQEAKEKLHKPLSQALNLAEDFLQLSRAEMIDNTAFDELDFTGLVHQAIDDAYDAAKEKQIRLERNIVEGVVWVKGNFGLLHRAILNLILNAVKYAPEQTPIQVNVELNVEHTQVMCSVSNAGVGIPMAEQEDLFKRFSRLKKHDKQTNGAGLGLYFVRTVAEKHHGYVTVKSEIDVMTTFKLQLPAVDYLVGNG
jgi:CHASE2 domain-containing sensor protein/two-component sensor histidine kinase